MGNLLFLVLVPFFFKDKIMCLLLFGPVHVYKGDHCLSIHSFSRYAVNTYHKAGTSV